MAIDFDPGRWEAIRENARRWWNGDLDRPLIQVRVGGRDPDRPAPALPPLTRSTLYDLSIPSEAIIDRWDYDLSRTEFLGDAFPVVWPDMGPGVLATFLGATARPTQDTVWFDPPVRQDIRDIHFTYHSGCPWLKRLAELYRLGMRRWEGRVLMGMTDLGGNLDVLATFRPGEKLLTDLIDHPDEVKRLTWEAHAAWHRAFDELSGLLQPVNPGYGAWTSIYSRQPYYILQCDFCYMIGPAMFDEFVKPELAATCGRLANPFYHLDGIGQLPHLDSLLTIAALKGVQWVPGAGRRSQAEWPEVYRKIRAAGKLVQVHGQEDGEPLLSIEREMGSARGVVQIAHVRPEKRAGAVALLERFGCPV